MDWLKAHKALVGLIFTFVSAGLAACPDPHCAVASHWLLVLGPALVAGGVMNSDTNEKSKQTFIANGGVDKRA